MVLDSGRRDLVTTFALEMFGELASWGTQPIEGEQVREAREVEARVALHGGTLTRHRSTERATTSGSESIRSDCAPRRRLNFTSAAPPQRSCDDSPMSESTVRLSRKELYELVWSSPVESLAARYGMSGVALAKHLKEMAIPRPGRGYWQQVEARMKPKRTPLGKAPAGTPEQIIFELRQRTPRPHVPKQDRPVIVVRDSLNRPDPIVRRLRELMEPSYRDRGMKSVLGDGHSVVKAGPANEKRAFLIVDALIGGLRARGHDARLTDTSERRHKLEAVIAGRGVELWLTERIDRTRCPPRTWRSETRCRRW